MQWSITEEAYRNSIARGGSRRIVDYGTPIYRWEECDAEEFIRYWLPKFESGELVPSECEVIGHELKGK